MLGMLLRGAVKVAPAPFAKGVSKKDMTPGNYIPKAIGWSILLVIMPIWLWIYHVNHIDNPRAVIVATAVVVFGLPVVIFTAWIATAMIAVGGVNRTPAKPAGWETPGEQNARRLRERAARIAGTMPATGREAAIASLEASIKALRERQAATAPPNAVSVANDYFKGVADRRAAGNASSAAAQASLRGQGR